MKNKIFFILKNWKAGVHLILRTKRFGVNNKWWSNFDSIWGLSWYKILCNIFLVYSLILNYKRMRVRATYLHFMDDNEKKLMKWENLPQH